MFRAVIIIIDPRIISLGTSILDALSEGCELGIGNTTGVDNSSVVSRAGRRLAAQDDQGLLES